jgi:hypothetical protein
MGIHIAHNEDTTYLDQRFLDHGKLRCVSWKKIRRIPHEHIIQWCVKNGVYQIPTKELIAWLLNEIGGRSAIEICAGRSCLGRHLNIPMTDSYMHTLPEIQRKYLAMGQPRTIPDSDVLRMEALEAVRHFHPRVVIAAWATQRGDGADGQSNPYGVVESELLDQVETYIHIGNTNVHDGKRIMKHPHREYSFRWLLSRGFRPTENRIWVWDNR